jgi:inosine-uridine nucleoside N-ribohydrolase
MPARDILLDTDIGDNSDDAFALALALASPKVNLLGVTTVFRNAPRRAALAAQLLRDWKSSTQVIAGTSKPLLEPYSFEMGAQFQILEDDIWEDTQRAVDFIIKSARVDEEPDPENRLTLVCIGPLSNIALAISVEPEIISRIEIVVMGGCWSEAKRETNINIDPEAAAIVFNSGAAIRMVGYDVTQQMRLSPEQLQQLKSSNSVYAAQLAQLVQIWMDETGEPPTLHDPLALLCIWSDCVRFEEKCIEVGLCGEERGLTIECDGEPNVLAAVEVDAPRALNEILSRIL